MLLRWESEVVRIVSSLLVQPLIFRQFVQGLVPTDCVSLSEVNYSYFNTELFSFSFFWSDALNSTLTDCYCIYLAIMHQQILLLFIYGLVSPEIEGGRKDSRCRRNNKFMYEIKKTKNRNSPINKELPCQKCEF